MMFLRKLVLFAVAAVVSCSTAQAYDNAVRKFVNNEKLLTGSMASATIAAIAFATEYVQECNSEKKNIVSYSNFSAFSGKVLSSLKNPAISFKQRKIFTSALGCAAALLGIRGAYSFVGAFNGKKSGKRPASAAQPKTEGFEQAFAAALVRAPGADQLPQDERDFIFRQWEQYGSESSFHQEPLDTMRKYTIYYQHQHLLTRNGEFAFDETDASGIARMYRQIEDFIVSAHQGPDRKPLNHEYLAPDYPTLQGFAPAEVLCILQKEYMKLPSAETITKISAEALKPDNYETVNEMIRIKADSTLAQMLTQHGLGR